MKEILQKCYYDAESEDISVEAEMFFHTDNHKWMLNGYRKSFFRNGALSSEEFYSLDNLHCTTGPAVTHYDMQGYIIHEKWYINGTFINITEFMEDNEFEEMCEEAITILLLNNA